MNSLIERLEQARDRCDTQADAQVLSGELKHPSTAVLTEAQNAINEALAYLKPRADFAARLSTASSGGQRGMSEKKPRLFYWEEAVDAWIPAPDDVSGIIEANQLDVGEPGGWAIYFKRFDMTDEEFANLPDGDEPAASPTASSADQ